MWQMIVSNVRLVDAYRLLCYGSMKRTIVNVHVSQILTAYPTDPVPELSNALTH